MRQINLSHAERKEIAVRTEHDQSIWENGKVKPISINPEDEALLSEYDSDYTEGFAEAIREESSFIFRAEARFDEHTIELMRQHLKNAFIKKKRGKIEKLTRNKGGEYARILFEETKKPEDHQLIKRLDDPSDVRAIDDTEAFIHALDHSCLPPRTECIVL